MLDLEPIKARADAMTRMDLTHLERGGPYPSVTVITCVDGGSGVSNYDTPEPPRYEPVAYIHDCGDDYNTPPPESAVQIAEFFAHSTRDVPALIAEVERLRKSELINYHANMSMAQEIQHLRRQLQIRDQHQLTARHVDVAKEWDDGWDVLRWAIEAGANIAEMRAWRRAGCGEDLFIEKENEK